MLQNRVVQVWVSGDGGDWSCGPSTHYRIPTQLFDYNMMIGRLNTKMDLQECAEQAAKEISLGLRKEICEYTNVYIAHDGNWAGLPPLLFNIPEDVFETLVKNGCSASQTIGSLTCEADLLALISATRKNHVKQENNDGMSICYLCGKCAISSYRDGTPICDHCFEIRTGAGVLARSNTEVKACGHRCTTSSLKNGCCSCLDARPIREGDTYPMYCDGRGWIDSASRDEGYCPYCRGQEMSSTPSAAFTPFLSDASKLDCPVSSAAFAAHLDAKYPISLVSDFFFPVAPIESGRKKVIYLCGNSLGLQPKGCSLEVSKQLEKWSREGVEGHFTEPTPWLTIDDTVKDSMAALVGAHPLEVVLMNSLTCNLHFMMASFFRPTASRFKIMIEKKAFPSDVHAVTSQLLHHGLDPAIALIEIAPRAEEVLLRQEDIDSILEQQGDSIALVLLSGVQYYTGQLFDMERITKIAHGKGCLVGFDLAHAVGNVVLKLHDWGCDFACWCTYKYMNCGPGSIGGCFVHENHGQGGEACRERLKGWWGHRLEDRFDMDPHFIASQGANGYRVSNPPVLLIACVRASLDMFEKVRYLKQLKLFLSY